MKNNYALILFLMSIFTTFSNYSQTTLKFQDFEGGTDDWTNTINPTTYNTSGDVWANVSSLGGNVTTSQNGSSFWGMRDLNNPNGGGNFDHTITFDNVDISSSNGVSISFYYITDGYDSADNLSVEIFHDDVSQGEVNLDKNTDAWTEFTASVPDAVNNVRLTIIARQDGGSDYAGVDNFKITEASTNPTVTFDSNTSTENETDTSFNTLIPVTFTNYSADVTINVTVDGSSTAEAGDYTLNTSSLTFTSNGTQNISLDINDDVDFEPETLILNIGVTSGSADIIRSQHTITINDDDLPIVINEINADPDSTNGDANGDGDSDTTEDEFVEIYNISGGPLDISGWVLADGASDRHVFPNGTIIPADETIVVFGGGTPVTVPGLVQTASTGSLGLNNTGDTITIKDESNNNIIVLTYGSAGSNQSIARNPDLTGSFVNHSNITSNPVLYSPGRDNTDNILFASTIKWSGVTDSDWNTASNWVDNLTPGSTDDVVIPAGLSNYPTVSSTTTVNSIHIGSGASLIANATINGNVTYSRNLPTNNWYLISSPVAGEAVQDFIDNHTLATGTISTNNLGLAPYNNTGATIWSYYQNGATTADDFVSGRGFSVKLASAGDISFTGTINSSNVQYRINTGGRNNFNLFGNPFTSYINSNTLVSLTANSNLLSEETVWLWNGTDYVAYNMANGTIEIAPGQGFFVESSTNGDLTFETSNQSHQSTDTFLREVPKSSFELFVENAGHKKGTKVFYIDGKTKGFDNGYDSKLFGGVDYDFAIYTELLNDNDGRHLAIQSLPSTDIETMIIPIGLITEANKEITFSIAETNLPSGVNIYLEDRKNNTFTNLSEGNHTITLKNTSNGIGQFYIRASAKSLSNEDLEENTSNISIYSSDNKEVTITGLQDRANLKVFSVLGEELADTNINSNGVSKVSLANLATGVYIIKLNSESVNITKKIILE
ncbi:lamin tail domain-containing protein [Tenacibaculum agarivorans]|uniref:lamin tail domain-containing protein n=1 Tax=Tenacibaculum agarivorans TaxID=1908389 RepID=UPI00094B8345|nr:lamin tail domain-containing protein [Tenacibaculum agarivorans]